MDVQATVAKFEAYLKELQHKIKEKESLLKTRESELEVAGVEISKRLKSLQEGAIQQESLVKEKSALLTRQISDLEARRDSLLAEIGRIVRDKGALLDKELGEKKAVLSQVHATLEEQKAVLQPARDKIKELKQLVSQLPD